MGDGRSDNYVLGVSEYWNRSTSRAGDGGGESSETEPAGWREGVGLIKFPDYAPRSHCNILGNFLGT